MRRARHPGLDLYHQDGTIAAYDEAVDRASQDERLSARALPVRPTASTGFVRRRRAIRAQRKWHLVQSLATGKQQPDILTGFDPLRDRDRAADGAVHVRQGCPLFGP